jgi:hypothetical protein
MAEHPYIVPAFADEINRGWLIGQMLIGYSEIEFELSMVVQGAYDHDGLMALRSMFRVRSESARVDVADALLQNRMVALGLSDEYEATLEAIQFCKRIRNTYSHSHWSLDGEDLRYYNYEEAAKLREPKIKVDFKYVDAKLLMRQLAYFNYTRYCLLHLQSRLGDHSGKKNADPQPWPERMQKPKLYNRKTKHEFPTQKEGR